MPRRPLALIAFDADDTLWHNERSYREGRERFRRLLADAGVALNEEALDARVNQTELANIPHYGYGVASFTLSLIETAIDLTGGRIAGADLRHLIDLAKRMLTEDVELFPGVREALARLSPDYPLMVITMGHLLHQTSKLERSGLRDCFRFVEIVSHKTRETYASILARHGIEPDRFLMIGNSLRSDVLPVVDAGGWAVHLPAAMTWTHDHAEVPTHAHGRYFEVASLERLDEVIETIERASV